MKKVENALPRNMAYSKPYLVYEAPDTGKNRETGAKHKTDLSREKKGSKTNRALIMKKKISMVECITACYQTHPVEAVRRKWEL